MDITRLKNNAKYYNNYDRYMCHKGEYVYDTEIVLFLKEYPRFNIHLWDGFFYDIFGKSKFTGEPWCGFTRDYSEFKGAFADENNNYTQLSNLQEYLQDMMHYKTKEFLLEETKEVVNLIEDFLRYAISTGQTVVMEVN